MIKTVLLIDVAHILVDSGFYSIGSTHHLTSFRFFIS